MLVDDVKIVIRAGHGGPGKASFKRNAQTAKGGPDGGNGGNGGDIYFQGIDDIASLSQFQYKKAIKAEDGIGGGKQNLYGRNGTDTTIFVPIGTSVTNTITGEILEINDVTSKILLAKGGKGGRGNNEFKSATHQTPLEFEPGEVGEEKSLHLELRLIADVGFIGLPNAGKSSLLKILTNAKPKIGNYAFTTLEPNLGVLFADNAKPIVIADIPGLIEGASKGKGLGITFLKHIEKTQLLVHCIDSTNEDIVGTYKIVQNEFAQYSKAILDKPEIVLLTKTDLIEKDALAKKVKEIKKIIKNPICISLYTPEDIDLIKATIVAHTQ